MRSRRPDFASFNASRRKTLRLSQEEMIRTSFLEPDRRFPLVVEPNVEDLNLATYARGNREFIESQLTRHGGILFRGFALKGVESFESVVSAVSDGALEYTERSSPRSRIAGNVYTSTDYPPEHPIFLHNEQSYNLVFPRKIMFFCLTAAEYGGATPIADCRRILNEIPMKIRSRFEHLGYIYSRNFLKGVGLSWEEAFRTAEKAEVESYCRRNKIEFEWKNGNGLHTRQVRKVVARHPQSGELTWFNHLTFFHVSTLVPEVRNAMLAEFSEEELPNNTYYGDGTAIEPSVLKDLREIYREETVSFPWKAGDLLLLDNMLVAHGREPFQGARKIAAAMAAPTSWDDVSV